MAPWEGSPLYSRPVVTVSRGGDLTGNGRQILVRRGPGRGGGVARVVGIRRIGKVAAGGRGVGEIGQDCGRDHQEDSNADDPSTRTPPSWPRRTRTEGGPKPASPLAGRGSAQPAGDGEAEAAGVASGPFLPLRLRYQQPNDKGPQRVNNLSGKNS